MTMPIDPPVAALSRMRQAPIMKFSERNGEDKGVIELRKNGYAIINWNGTTYRGRWEKVDEYHVRTIWNSSSGAPPGGV